VKTVRIGVIGVGGMGSGHARSIASGNVKRAELVAVCDLVEERREAFGDDVKKYASSKKLIRSGEVDAVVIATPHYDHTVIGIDSLKQGLHTLVEKPISVHKADCERLIAAHTKRKQVFAAMFNQRTDPHYHKVKKLIVDGELGKLTRINWIITSWFRSQQYYDGGGWRATWAGEGGGVLVNQCPHQLDMLQWLGGMPTRVSGFCGIGKYHKIEVEDEVTAYFDYKNGATGVFITSTGEAPGTNRLEIVGDRGRVVVEGGKITFTRNEESSAKFLRTSKEWFATPDVWNVDIPAHNGGGQHTEIMQNFVDAILDGKPLIAPAREGIRSVELGNAILYSSLTGKPVDLPLDGKKYERMLKKLIKESTFVKKAVKTKKVRDLTGSF
jgi:predicted dehydrogenase